MPAKEAEGRAVGINRTIEGGGIAAEAENAFAVQRGANEDKREGFAKAERDIGVVPATGVLPEEPFLFAVDVAGKEIHCGDEAGFDNDGRVNERGAGAGEALPDCGEPLGKADAHSAGARGPAKLRRIDFGGRPEPAAGNGELRAARTRAQGGF